MANRKALTWTRWMLLGGVGMIGLFTCVALGTQLATPTAIVTFNTSVEVPGSKPQVLPAGTYTFKVVDSKVNRNIVQISSKDETHIHTTILAIPTRRDEESDKTIILFQERAAGEPQALRAWFYPFNRSGQEFAYSKTRATELAKLSNSPVPYIDGDSAGVAEPANGSAAASDATSIQIVKPAGEPAPRR